MSIAPAALTAATVPAPRPGWAGVVHASVVMTPLLLVHLALFALPFLPFSVWNLVIMFALTRVTGLGITVGFHRYFSHRSFKTSRWFQFLLAAAGCTALQRGPLWWVQHHRVHHRHSDTPGDVHSPVVGGFWHGHFGWLFARVTERAGGSLVRDLTRYPELVWLERLWLVPAVLFAAACFAVGGWAGVVYWYCLNVVIVSHMTYSVNSIGHLFGARRFATADGSRNNLLLGYLTLGDGWHNNHHRAPSSARHGFAWYEFDVSYLTIRLFARLGLVWGVRTPPPEVLAGHDPAPRGEMSE
jgi:stearoyl-CoA desaturase (delta-9 desaturase)